MASELGRKAYAAAGGNVERSFRQMGLDKFIFSMSLRLGYAKLFLTIVIGHRHNIAPSLSMPK